METVTGRREVQKTHPRQSIPEKKILHPSECRYKNSSKGGNEVTLIKGRTALLIPWE